MQNVPWEKNYIKYINLNAWIDVNSKNYKPKQIYELNNCITRYFLSISLPSPDRESNKDRCYRKFLQELKDKRLEEKTDIRHFEFTMDTIVTPTTFNVSLGRKGTVDEGNVFIKCGNMGDIIPRDRYEILRAMSSDEDIVCMLMRYATFAGGSFSWQVPFKVYERLYDKHGLTLEGCASPINSQLQLVSPFRGRYCSAFKEDQVFGSIGSIFNIDLEGEFALLNPPFVEDFMLFLVNKVIKTLNSANIKTTIIFVVPAWADSKPHIDLSKSKWLRARYDLTPGDYHYEDSLTNKAVRAKFGSTVFVLSNKDVDISDAIELFKQ